MINIIPIQARPNQVVNTVVNGQQITFNIYLRNDEHLFCDIFLQGLPVILGVPCNTGVYLNQYASDIVGYLFFYNSTGLDPTYQELGGTCQLYYTDYDALQYDYDAWLVTQ